MLLLVERDAFDARGRVRGPIVGAAVQIGRRSATADVWLDRDGAPVVRFQTAHLQHWFSVSARRQRLEAIPTEIWHEEIGDRLAEWLLDAMDGEFD